MTDPIAAIEALELSIREILGREWSPYSALPLSEDFDPSESVVWPLVQLLLNEPSVSHVQSHLQRFRDELTEVGPDEAEDLRVAGLLKDAFDRLDDAELDQIEFDS
ncbi:MAG TPA: hypothetical protein PLO61_10105 [Fimbriimonadaceae bacterium]|nr:hypothetical protein [Fimbriimonadaceae bacterium]HRJ33942.1 hypothetical protein [Fimbriimonadaceae bacterium]